ncbi:MAG: 2-oxoacid:ferredoxin oxidoreductase subunit beta, partial [Hyphomicrobiales bacterium]|nr:2-oxoacid:ferredoxin oxidoreductase subunit beta [Hyphomicrobiales bacterium]
INLLHQRAAAGEIATGLIYVDKEPSDLHHHLATVEKPLNELGEEELCPGSAVLEKLNAGLR